MLRAPWFGSAIGMSAALLTLIGCGGRSESSIDSALLSGADETAFTESALTGSYAIGTTLATTAALHLRTGPSTSNGVIRTIPAGAQVVTVNRTTPSNGWYNIRFQGSDGWSAGNYLRLVSTPPPAGPPSSARDAAIERAGAGVGFSYWWGHGRFLPAGPSGSTRGSCTGSCPSCSHGGSYGADCSGYVAKIWQVPGNNTTLSSDSHPYSTWNFDNESHGWHAISRGSLRRADALVYNTSGEGHIFLYEGGDSWGSMWAYEAKGCATGIVHDLRTVTSAYKALARDGY